MTRSSNALLFLAITVSSFSLAGCSQDVPEENEEEVGASTEAIIGTACTASRAEGAVGSFEKALHDSIAFAEGTEKRGSDGYNVGFAYKIFGSCARHPNITTCSGGLCSTAAGRYQFLKRTWDSTARATGAKTFAPEEQERGAQYLITKVRKVSVPPGRAMTATELSNAMKKLSYEWASLPPGRYGQPNRSLAEIRTDYCRNAGC